MKRAVYAGYMSTLLYDRDMSASEMVRQHAYDYVNEKIGTYLPDSEGVRFNPLGVALYQPSASGIYRRIDDVVAALRAAEIQPHELRGASVEIDSIVDQLVVFDENSARPLSELEGDFIQDINRAVHEGLSGNGVIPSEVLIDAQGIISWKGEVATTESARGKMQQASGFIGQVFVPDEKGVFTTSFNSGTNYAYVPGYRAEILPQEMGEQKSVEERTKLIGYKQQMVSDIIYQLRQDLLVVYANDPVGSPTSLNGVYRGLYGDKYHVNFRERMIEAGMRPDIIDAIVQTQSQRVRYSNEVRNGSTIDADYRARTSWWRGNSMRVMIDIMITSQTPMS